MRNLAFFLVMMTFTTIVNAQTWLEKSMNGLTYGNTEPDTSAIPNLYSEPIDTAWRFGNVGIGTHTWPKVKLQVHSNRNVDSNLDYLLNNVLGSGYNGLNSVFTNGGNSESPFANSILGFVHKTDELGSSISSMGISMTNGLEESHGLFGASIGGNNWGSFGVSGIASGEGNEFVVGVKGVGEGDNNTFGNFGVWGECINTTTNAVNVGVFGQGNEVFHMEDDPESKSLVNIGVHGKAFCDGERGGTQFNAGVFGQNVGCSDSTEGGSSYPTGSYAGYFDGNVLVTGWIAELSDRRLKENVKSIEGALERLKKVNVYSYNYKQGMGLSLSNSLSYGVIADELEKDFPELVKNVNVINHKDPNSYRNIESYKSVNYIEMIPILLQAVKELDEKIDALDPERSSSSLKTLKDQIDNLNGNLKQVAVTSNLRTTSSLKAFPNPSQSDVTIEIDQVNCNDCWLLVTDLSGKIILQQQIHQSYEKIVLSKGKLGSGIYQANLVEGGNVTNSVKIALLQ